MFSRLKKKLTEWLTKDAPYEGIPLCDFETLRYEVRPCDVLLVEGRSRVSEVIKQVTQSPWTHSCLYIGRLHDIDDPALQQRLLSYYSAQPDEQLVIEGYLGKGTIVTPLSYYHKDHIRICRPRGLSREDAQIVTKHAVNRLGTDYDVRQIFDLLRFMMPWSVLPRRWRSSLFEGQDSTSARTVCSTMIAHAFNEINFPILPTIKLHEETGIELIKSNPRLITPKDFDYSPYFDIIKYPFMSFSDRGYYHKLPWKQEPPDETGDPCASAKDLTPKDDGPQGTFDWFDYFSKKPPANPNAGEDKHP